MLARQRLDERPSRGVGPLKKSGSPNVMCCGARRDLRRDVGQHDVDRHDAELSVVDRHDRAMAAAVLASAARLGVSDDLVRVAGLKRGVTREAVGGPTDRACMNRVRGSRVGAASGASATRCTVRRAGDPVGELQQILLRTPDPSTVRDAVLAQRRRR